MFSAILHPHPLFIIFIAIIHDSFSRPWVMEGSPVEGEEAAKDPAAKQKPLGMLMIDQ